MNKITLTGIVSRINNEEYNNQIWFDICNNEKYKDKDGNIKEVPSFFNARIAKERMNKYNIKVGQLITVDGIPKSYKDKNGNTKSYIYVLEIREFNKSNGEDTISYDKDGVMLWKGQRCESKEATEEEIKEMEDLLSEFK